MPRSQFRMIESHHLYNILNSYRKQPSDPCISDPNYLYLVDARTSNEYHESHILFAILAARTEGQEFLKLDRQELEFIENVIIYDSNTKELGEFSYAPAAKCGLSLQKFRPGRSIMVLKGGYEAFSALYPFLRTHKCMYTIRELNAIELYPLEILSKKLYIGTDTQGSNFSIQKKLHLTNAICCSEEPKHFYTNYINVLRIHIDDSVHENLFIYFKKMCEFINTSLGPTLVCSTLCSSRAPTIAIAYLIYIGWTLKKSLSYVKQCRPYTCPNAAFIEQLQHWEKSKAILETVSSSSSSEKTISQISEASSRQFKHQLLSPSSLSPQVFKTASGRSLLPQYRSTSPLKTPNGYQGTSYSSTLSTQSSLKSPSGNY